MTNAPHVAVITATIGHRNLGRALASVQNQIHPCVKHLVVVDGREFLASVEPVVAAFRGSSNLLDVLVLPQRTGLHGWCSHRIYAAAPFLVEADYLAFLDQDNWFTSHHITSLLSTLLDTGSPAAFALRNIYGHEEDWVCADDCQSLGPLQDCFDRPGEHHIDSNCWLIASRLAAAHSRYWLKKYTGDRSFAASMMRRLPDLPCSHEYSVNYTAGSRIESARPEYFLAGNAVIRNRFPAGLPWRASRAPENAE